MKEVILHVGMHKTGTSSIQASLASYDDGTTVYAQLEVPNHSIPITTVFADDPESYHIWKSQGASPDLVRQRKNLYSYLLNRHLRDSTRERLIISAEDIGNLTYDEQRRLIDYFRSRDLDLKVICLTRDPRSLMSSLVQQHIRGGIAPLGEFRLDYRAYLKCFYDNLPHDRIIVRDFEAMTGAHGDVVRAFSILARIRPEHSAATRENESLSADAARLVFRFNELPVNSFGDGNRVIARDDLITFLSATFPNKGEVSQIDKDISFDLATIDGEDLRFIKELAGIEYPVQPHDARFDRMPAYLTDLSQIDIPAFASRLEEIGASPSRSADLDSMLIDLYFHFLGKVPLVDPDAMYLRDIAIKIAEGDDLTIGDATALMKLAHRARPTGPFINQKLQEYASRPHTELARPAGIYGTRWSASPHKVIRRLFDRFRA